MNCPKCQNENFQIEKPCAECGFQGDTQTLMELQHLDWLLKQMESWEELHLDTAAIAELKKLYKTRFRNALVSLGLRLPPLTPAEAEKAWVELSHLEALFEKATEWQTAGYLNPEMAGQDPFKSQRAYAAELRERLEEHPHPDLASSDQSRLKTISFLLDYVDLLASREWFKSKADLEQAIAPLMKELVGITTDNAPKL
ncbi:MAG: hypothetical protein IT311_11460 [Anaerolineales bacterium]|nr:hypothetical protein [Anaerolineales bacterium]